MKKKTIEYHFLVEGETEQRYLNWLQKQVNKNIYAKYNVKFVCTIGHNACSYVKNKKILYKTDAYRVIDYEGQAYKESFLKNLNDMKKAGDLGKQISFKLAYSNLAFELWIILHKADCNSPKNSCKEYLRLLNALFNENFVSLTQFKEESNLEKCLNKLLIQDVINAIERAEKLMITVNSNYKEAQYKTFKYFEENPSLSLHIHIKQILQGCGLY